MRLAVGDVVVYSVHALGRVTARQQQMVRGVRQQVVVLQFADGLTVSLPLDRAREQLRPLASETEIGRVQETLRTEAPVSTQPWLARQRQTQAKLADGEPVGLAEIVRDGAARERSPTAKGAKPTLSEGERRVFLKAWQLLSNEIGQVRNLTTTDADHWIGEQLAGSP